MVLWGVLSLLLLLVRFLLTIWSILPTYTIFSSNPKHFRKDFYVDWNIY